MIYRKHLLLLLLIPGTLFFQHCSSNQNSSPKLSIIELALSETSSPFYINSTRYKEDLKTLPIGIFDSGTGGLAVLEAILNLDEFNNETHQPGSDNISDFISESFIYLADEANMPYGRYDAEGKADFLRELVVKDVLFLIGTNYFLSPGDKFPQNNKKQVKEIVIACNTATAYGLETVNDAIRSWDLPIKITGIIEAGAKNAIQEIVKNEIQEPLIAVFATEGTCSSSGYPKSINGQTRDEFSEFDLQVLQQAGVGLAGAIDGDINYVDPVATEVRKADKYFGPGFGNENYSMDLKYWNDYNFEGGNELFMEINPEGDTTVIQLNSIRNYVRYMVTNLIHNASANFPDRSIDIVILGCTHYPYELDEIRNHFKFLKNNTKYVNIIPDSIVFIDPAKALATALYTNLIKNDLFGNNSIDESEFYISVPNPLLEENKIDSKMEFPFEWKYGRTENAGLQYVKIVPFSDRWIDADIKERIKGSLPSVYNILK